MKTKRILQLGSVLLICLAIAWFPVQFLPIGLPRADDYFKPLNERKLQTDEIGQIKAVEESFFELSLQGDDFKGWDTEHQDFWKYSIAFSAYGIPSMVMIDPDNKDRYQALMDTMIWKMKSRKVWGDFTDRGFGADPITVQNIMYKGHLNLMYGLYELATGDERYSREFTWLTEQLIREMRLHHKGIYEGVTCEPGAWFVECNAIGMMSLHVYDKLYGTSYTENEVKWSVDFIMNRMRDPKTGLFFRAYLPNHDLVKEQISGYANAWILSFLEPFISVELAELYPSFKSELVEEFGPYAGVLERQGGSPDQVAQIFGMWAAKEHRDIRLFSKLRNSVDKFGGLSADGAGEGLVYNDPNSVLINGVILSSKVHMGWSDVFAYPWESLKKTREIPDTSDLDWTKILPQQVYSTERTMSEALPEITLKRACPSCFWGDYQSVRMTEAAKLDSCEALDPVSGCSLDNIDSEITEVLSNGGI